MASLMGAAFGAKQEDLMKQLGIMFLAVAALALAGCGSNSNNNINGNWTASLMSSNSSNTPVMGFNVTLNQTSGSSLSVTNLSFTSSSPCFAGGSTATGGFTLSGNFNGVTSGGFQMNVQSTPTAGSNLLTLQGTVNNNTINGTWTLTGTGSGCTGTGSFTMNKT